MNIFNWSQQEKILDNFGNQFCTLIVQMAQLPSEFTENSPLIRQQLQYLYFCNGFGSISSALNQKFNPFYHPIIWRHNFQDLFKELEVYLDVVNLQTWLPLIVKLIY